MNGEIWAMQAPINPKDSEGRVQLKDRDQGDVRNADEMTTKGMTWLISHYAFKAVSPLVISPQCKSKESAE